MKKVFLHNGSCKKSSLLALKFNSISKHTIIHNHQIIIIIILLAEGSQLFGLEKPLWPRGCSISRLNLRFLKKENQGSISRPLAPEESGPMVLTTCPIAWNYNHQIIKCPWDYWVKEHDLWQRMFPSQKYSTWRLLKLGPKIVVGDMSIVMQAYIMPRIMLHMNSQNVEK